MSGFSLDQNVIIKHPVPAVGIVCSNPQRAERLANIIFSNSSVLVSQWGITVYHGQGLKDGKDLFIAVAPMGASGSAFCFHELMAAGARKVIRYGSNDIWVTEEDLDKVVLVSESRGLRGISFDHGIHDDKVDEPMKPSQDLFNELKAEVDKKGSKYLERVCFNVDDYHGFLYPDLSASPDTIRKRLAYYDSFGPYCRDMETASLFLKGNEFGVEVAAVLQNVIKQKKEAPYQGTSGTKAIEMETEIANLLVDVLSF